MKTIKATSFFKKVTKAQAEKSPALLSKVDKKRADITWHFSGLDHESSSDFVRDLESLKDEHLAFFINRAIETYARDLIADKGADWDFMPTPESLTLAAAFDYYNTESDRKRTLTKVSASAFAAVYAKFAPTVLGITNQQAGAAATAIAEYMKYSKDEKVRPALLARLEAFANAVAEAEDDSDFAVAVADHVEVLMALLKAFSEKDTSVEITADAL